jgi:sugar phosphate isomerase/epimerase
MSSTYAEPLDRLDAVLDELAAIGPEFRTVADRQEFLLRISRVIGRAEAERLRVLAASDDIAVATGDRSTATWLATQTREAHGTVRRHAALADSLGSRWTQTADALGAGDLK